LDAMSTMESLFSPCTRRYRDILESQGRLEGFRFPYENFRELNLGVSIEEFLSAERAFTYADLYAMLGNRNTVAWLTPHAAVVCERDRALSCATFLPDEENYRFSFNVDGTEIFAVARSSAALAEIVDVVIRLLVANARDVSELHLRNVSLDDEGILNAPSLAYLMEHRQSLKCLTLKDQILDKDHCRVLGACSRPGLEIELTFCELTSAGTRALAEVLRRNQGPTRLDNCAIDHSVLADGLRGNSRLKRLRPMRL
jgi:hypothetical protein